MRLFDSFMCMMLFFSCMFWLISVVDSLLFISVFDRFGFIGVLEIVSFSVVCLLSRQFGLNRLLVVFSVGMLVLMWFDSGLLLMMLNMLLCNVNGIVMFVLSVLIWFVFVSVVMLSWLFGVKFVWVDRLVRLSDVMLCLFLIVMLLLWCFICMWFVVFVLSEKFQLVLSMMLVCIGGCWLVSVWCILRKCVIDVLVMVFVECIWL